MAVSSADNAVPAAGPVFGFILFGGPLSGAMVRDVRLANELADRGFPVHVWWAMDRTRSAPLRPAIAQHWLFNGLRYFHTVRGTAVGDATGRALTRLLHEKNRLRWTQKLPDVLRVAMEGLVRRACAGPAGDRRLMKRFVRGLRRSGVTHLMPMLEILGAWTAAAQDAVGPSLRYLVTFQGYELYVHYAQAIGLEQQLYRTLIDAVERSTWPAVAVSEDYLDRVVADIGVPRSALRAIPPGIPTEFPFDAARAPALLKAGLADYRPGVPLVTFLGRRDTEKGIDLLLYAAALLRRRGIDFQLAICGPTLFGDHYGRVCRQLAVDLRCPVMWRNQVSDELRSALFTSSRCIVYPSVHREPFGMVAVEAAAHGTPSIVPDYGGIAGAIEAPGAVAGLRFRTWDSADLAQQLERILTDDALHRSLSEAGPRVAAHYSVPRLADRVLTHMGLPLRPGG
jgi:glycosyltransferase involved in cell wall biosynthesis